MNKQEKILETEEKYQWPVLLHLDNHDPSLLISEDADEKIRIKLTKFVSSVREEKKLRLDADRYSREEFLDRMFKLVNNRFEFFETIFNTIKDDIDYFKKIAKEGINWRKIRPDPASLRPWIMGKITEKGEQEKDKDKRNNK